MRKRPGARDARQRSFAARGMVAMGVVVVGVVGALDADEMAPVSTRDPSHPFVKRLEARYDALLKAERWGDIAAYKKLRTKERMAAIDAHLKTLDPPEDLRSKLRALASFQQDHRQYRLLSCDARGDRARLSYIRDSDLPHVSSEPRVEFLIIMFQREDGAWRIGPIKHASTPRVDEDGRAATLSEFLEGDQRFLLEP